MESAQGNEGLFFQASSGVAAPVESELTHPEPQTQEQFFNNVGQQQQAQQQPAHPAQQPTQSSQYVPYERFAEQVHSRKMVESKLGAMEETLNKLKSALGASDDQTMSAQQQAEFYKDPHKYVESRIAEVTGQTERLYPAAQEAIDYELTKRQFRQLHGPNSDVENQMVKVIQDYGLQHSGAGRGSAIKLAYRVVTGKELDSFSPSKSVKGSVQGVPSGSGGVDDQNGVSDLAALKKMTPSEVEKFGPSKWFQQIQSAMKTQAT